jgi:hypothetical protein
MKRIDFFKGFFGAVGIMAIPTIPVVANEIEHFSFDELFEQPYNNEILFYPKKDCKLYKMIKELVGSERILDSKHEGPYLGYHYNLLVKKESYTIEDFRPFALALNSHYSKRNFYSEKDRGVFFRMIDQKNGTMYFDTFLGYPDGKSQYRN